MKVVDISNEIYLENASPSDTSIASIAYWVRSNVGKLNTILYESFYVDTTTLEIMASDGTEIGIIPASVIKMMYQVYRLELDIRRTFTSMQTDTVIEGRDLDFSVKRINRNEILKTLTQSKKDTLKELTDLVHNYRSYFGAPSQVTGDDTQQGFYQGTTWQYVRNVTMGGGN